jgi:hypothetical protein
VTSRPRTVRPAPEDVLARVPEWSGCDVSWEPLGGGLSHEIYLVNAGHERAVLHILNPDIDRFLEFDYWAGALDKWGQAVRDLESPEFGPLMKDARGAE